MGKTCVDLFRVHFVHAKMCSQHLGIYGKQFLKFFVQAWVARMFTSKVAQCFTQLGPGHQTSEFAHHWSLVLYSELVR